MANREESHMAQNPSLGKAEAMDGSFQDSVEGVGLSCTSTFYSFVFETDYYKLLISYLHHLSADIMDVSLGAWL